MNFSENRNDIVYSGGFDPLHVDHLDRMYEAKQRAGDGNQLIVIVEPDSFVEKKHPCLLPQEDRAQIVRSVKWVDRVYLATEKFTTADLLSILRPRAYMIGQDHDPEDIPERVVCAEHRIHIVQFGEYGSTPHPRSSTEILNNYLRTVMGYKSQYKPPKYDNPPVTVSLIIESVTAGPDRVLIGKRLGVGCSDLFGGFLEPGESLEQAACREMFEETGIKISQYQGNFRYITSQYGTYKDGRQIVCVYFACQLGDISAFRPSDEIHEVEWVTSTPGDMHSKEDEMALHYYFLSRNKQR